MWDIRQGLITAWDMDIKFLNANVDSTFVLTCLTSAGNLAPELFCIISNYRMLLSREWVVHLHHIQRVANSIANDLTKKVRMKTSLLETFNDCPLFIFCKYVWDFLCIETLRECPLVPVIGHLSDVFLEKLLEQQLNKHLAIT